MNLDFQKGDGLIPVIVQHAQNREVIMLGYMNEAALAKTQELGKITFYSRSKQRLWTKGESSGNFLKLVSWKADCDRDTLLFQAIPEGPTCHTGSDTCFGDYSEKADIHFLLELQALLQERKARPQEGSYTSALFQKPLRKIAQKVGEEAVETILEAEVGSQEDFTYEAGDLLFHLLTLLVAKDMGLEDLIAELKKRHKPQ